MVALIVSAWIWETRLVEDISFWYQMKAGTLEIINYIYSSFHSKVMRVNIMYIMYMFYGPIRKCHGCHKVTRWSQGGHKVVALSQGCFKLVTTLYKIPRLSQVLSQGCHKVVKWV